MDTGNKTLAQLSEEGKNARYVTLEVGSKLSGYTKEYLERLCAMNKVSFLLWNNEQHVIELSSLLKETHTILLSYEGLTFVDKAGLSVPPQMPFFDAQIAEKESAQNEVSRPLAAQIPHFSEHGRLPSRASNAGMFSFTGRAVVSDSRHPDDAEDNETHIPLSVSGGGETGEQGSVLLREEIPAVLEKSPEVLVQAAPMHAPLHIPITRSHEPSAAGQDAAKSVSLPVTRGAVSPEDPVQDDWDHRLLGGSNAAVKVEAPAVIQASVLPSSVAPTILPTYHPIQTSVDATPHHEDLPLFPKLIDKSLPPITPSFLKEQETVQVEPPAPPVAPLLNVTEVKTPSPLLQVIHHSLPSLASMSQVPMTEQKSLPARPPEHHLAVFESHPLMKSAGFNMSFALLFLIPSFIMFSGIFRKEDGTSPVKEMNIAAVAASDGTQMQQQKSAPVPQKEAEKLEFSDEVVAAPGETHNSVLVQPIFKDGAGMVHEYFNALLESGTTSDAHD